MSQIFRTEHPQKQRISPLFEGQLRHFLKQFERQKVWLGQRFLHFSVQGCDVKTWEKYIIVDFLFVQIKTAREPEDPLATRLQPDSQ